MAEQRLVFHELCPILAEDSAALLSCNTGGIRAHITQVLPFRGISSFTLRLARFYFRSVLLKPLYLNPASRRLRMLAIIQSLINIKGEQL